MVSSASPINVKLQFAGDSSVGVSIEVANEGALVKWLLNMADEGCCVEWAVLAVLEDAD